MKTEGETQMVSFLRQPFRLSFAVLGDYIEHSKIVQIEKVEIFETPFGISLCDRQTCSPSTDKTARRPGPDN